MNAMKHQITITALLISVLLLLTSTVSYHLGKRAERKLLNRILPVALEMHHEKYATNYPTIEKIAIENDAFLLVQLFVRNGYDIAVEEQAFDRFGNWQGYAIDNQSNKNGGITQ